jgi:hypothetical protein
MLRVDLPPARKLELHLGRHPALEGVESWGELLIAVLPQPKKGHLVRSIVLREGKRG